MSAYLIGVWRDLNSILAHAFGFGHDRQECLFCSRTVDR
jgi:hypothetical protein